MNFVVSVARVPRKMNKKKNSDHGTHRKKSILLIIVYLYLFFTRCSVFGWLNEVGGIITHGRSVLELSLTAMSWIPACAGRTAHFIIELRLFSALFGFKRLSSIVLVWCRSISAFKRTLLSRWLRFFYRSWNVMFWLKIVNFYAL